MLFFPKSWLFLSSSWYLLLYLLFKPLSPYILAMNLTFPLPILLSPGPELMTPLQNYVMLPIFVACLNDCLTTAGKCSKTLQRPPLFLLKLGKYLRLRRFACVFGSDTLRGCNTIRSNFIFYSYSSFVQFNVYYKGKYNLSSDIIWFAVVLKIVLFCKLLTETYLPINLVHL